MINAAHTTPTERRIARRLVEAALAKGYAVSVRDGMLGGQWTVRQSTDLDTILRSLATTEADTLAFSEPKSGPWERIGAVVLIWGNDEDLISESTTADAILELCRIANTGTSL